MSTAQPKRKFVDNKNKKKGDEVPWTQPHQALTCEQLVAILPQLQLHRRSNGKIYLKVPQPTEKCGFSLNVVLSFANRPTSNGLFFLDAAKVADGKYANHSALMNVDVTQAEYRVLGRDAKTPDLNASDSLIKRVAELLAEDPIGWMGKDEGEEIADLEDQKQKVFTILGKYRKKEKIVEPVRENPKKPGEFFSMSHKTKFDVDQKTRQIQNCPIFGLDRALLFHHKVDTFAKEDAVVENDEERASKRARSGEAKDVSAGVAAAADANEPNADQAFHDAQLGTVPGSTEAVKDCYKLVPPKSDVSTLTKIMQVDLRNGWALTHRGIQIALDKVGPPRCTDGANGPKCYFPPAAAAVASGTAPGPVVATPTSPTVAPTPPSPVVSSGDPVA